MIDYSVVEQGESLSGEVSPAVVQRIVAITMVHQACLSNAKYAVTMARMIGAPVYALPEDISQVGHQVAGAAALPIHTLAGQAQDGDDSLRQSHAGG